MKKSQKPVAEDRECIDVTGRKEKRRRSVRCGENAGNVFKAAEMKIYKSQVEDARENIELLKEEKLSELTKFHAGFHGIQ